MENHELSRSEETGDIEEVIKSDQHAGLLSNTEQRYLEKYYGCSEFELHWLHYYWKRFNPHLATLFKFYLSQVIAKCYGYRRRKWTLMEEKELGRIVKRPILLRVTKDRNVKIHDVSHPEVFICI